MDVIILSWLTNTISPDLMDVARERGHIARHLWLRLQNQFHGNRETHTLHLDVAFRNLVHGDLHVSEYCHKFKGMANALADLGPPTVDDRIFILNILHGLNQRIEHVGAIIQHHSPFPNFLKVQDDLLLEEIHLDTSGPAIAPTVFYSNNTLPAPLWPPLVSCPPGNTSGSGPGNGNNSNNNRNKNNKCHNGGNGNSGKNDSSGGGHAGNSGNTTMASTGSTSNDGKATSPCPTYVNKW
jgi:hypothetical protein